jgi:hypothetical protein
MTSCNLLGFSVLEKLAAFNYRIKQTLPVTDLACYYNNLPSIFLTVLSLATETNCTDNLFHLSCTWKSTVTK